MKKLISAIALSLCAITSHAAFGLNVVTSEYTTAQADSIADTVAESSNTWNSVTNKASVASVATNAAWIGANSNLLASAVQDLLPNDPGGMKIGFADGIGDLTLSAETVSGAGSMSATTGYFTYLEKDTVTVLNETESDAKYATLTAVNATNAVQDVDIATRLRTDAYNYQYEYATTDLSVNMANMSALRQHIADNAGMKIFVLGDAWGTPGYTRSGICRGVVMELIDQYGFRGSVGSQMNFAEGAVIDSVTDAGSPLRNQHNHDEWFGRHHLLNSAGDAIRFFNTYAAQTAYGMDRCETIGCWWVARPEGGDFDFKIRSGGSTSYPWNTLATLDGYAATPTLMHTNFTATGDYTSLNSQLQVSNRSASVNLIIGAEWTDSEAYGVETMWCWIDGGAMSQIVSTNQIRDALAEYDPDLILWNFGDLGQIEEADYRSYMTGKIPYMFSAATNATVVLLGMNYAVDPTLDSNWLEELIIRDGAISNNWVYYDARYNAGSFTNAVVQGWPGGSYTNWPDLEPKIGDPVMLYETGERAYATRLLTTSGLIGPPTAGKPQDASAYTGMRDYAVLEASPRLVAPIYAGQTNLLTGWTSEWDGGSVVSDRAGAEIEITKSGLYRFEFLMRSSRDSSTTTFWLYNNSAATSESQTYTHGPTTGVAFSGIVEADAGDVLNLYGATSTSTYLTNCTFFVERLDR